MMENTFKSNVVCWSKEYLYFLLTNINVKMISNKSVLDEIL